MRLLGPARIMYRSIPSLRAHHASFEAGLRPGMSLPRFQFGVWEWDCAGTV